MNRVIAAFVPLVSQTISFICIYIYMIIYVYIKVCVWWETNYCSGTHKDHPGLHTFSMSHQPLFALQAEKRLDGFIDQKSGVIHFEGGMSLEYFSQGLWGCMFQFCIWYGTCLHQQRLDFNSCRMPDFEAVPSFFASNLRGGGDDLQQWDRHIRPLATEQTVKGGWLVGWLPSEAWKICQECLYASELRLVQD